MAIAVSDEYKEVAKDKSCFPAIYYHKSARRQIPPSYDAVVVCRFLIYFSEAHRLCSRLIFIRYIVISNRLIVFHETSDRS